MIGLACLKGVRIHAVKGGWPLCASAEVPHDWPVAPNWHTLASIRLEDVTCPECLAAHDRFMGTLPKP